MECIIAKIFGSEAQKEAAIELCMKTHGGRSFLHGHILGDHLHEYLAPCIYEGEGEMLGMAFFKSLVKHHGTTYFEPIGKALQAAGIKKPSPWNPAHMWALKDVMKPYAAWWLKQYVTPAGTVSLPSMPEPLRAHAQWATQRLQSSALDISGVMRKHQLRLADRQCRMSLQSARIQKLIVILCTSLYAARATDEITRAAADVICHDLRLELTGKPPSDRHFRRINNLGEAIADDGSQLIANAPAAEILMPYEA
jgi:hypothetical protein